MSQIVSVNEHIILDVDAQTNAALVARRGVSLKSIASDGTPVVGYKSAYTEADYGVTTVDQSDTSGRITVRRLGVVLMDSNEALSDGDLVTAVITTGKCGKFQQSLVGAGERFSSLGRADSDCLAADRVVSVFVLPGIPAVAGGFRMEIGPFVQDNLAAAQTDVALSLGASAAPQKKYIAKRAGSIVGISVSSTVAAAGAIASFEVLKNGVKLGGGVLTTTLDAAHSGGLKNSATFTKGTYAFVAEDDLSVVITTPGGWSAITADAAVYLEIETA